jgi:hypothetical protein
MFDYNEPKRLEPIDVQEMLDEIKYKDWTFFLGNTNGVMYLEIRYWEGNNLCRGNQWIISPYIRQEQIVLLAYKAVKDILENQAQEYFTLSGRAIYNGDINAYELWEISEKHRK